MNTFDRPEPSTKPQDPYMRLLKYIVWTIVIGLLCAGALYGLFYLSINLPYIRANSAIDRAKGQVSPLHDQMTALTSPSVEIKNKTGVQSSMYAFSLSDSADQYAHVWSKIDLESNVPTQEVMTIYQTFWAAKGFSEVSRGDAKYIFQSQDEFLVSGICRTSQNIISSKLNYVAFIDYANGPRCDNPNGRYACLINAYCLE